MGNLLVTLLSDFSVFSHVFWYSTGIFCLCYYWYSVDVLSFFHFFWHFLANVRFWQKKCQYQCFQEKILTKNDRCYFSGGWKSNANGTHFEPCETIPKTGNAWERGGTWDIGINHLFPRHQTSSPRKEVEMYEKGGDMGHTYRPFLSKHQWVTYW